ncbi:MAG TPA: DUF3054 domain-containing protein [Acidimicrobiia bacterium]
MHPVARRSAPLIDTACFALFVALGRDDHGLHGGIVWFLGVIWPLLLGWFVAAVAARLYTRGDHAWARFAVTLVVAVLLGGLFRWLFAGRVAFSTFTIVELCFIGLFTGGWRVVAKLVVRRRGPAGVNA